MTLGVVGHREVVDPGRSTGDGFVGRWFALQVPGVHPDSSDREDRGVVRVEVVVDHPAQQDFRAGESVQAAVVVGGEARDAHRFGERLDPVGDPEALVQVVGVGVTRWRGREQAVVAVGRQRAREERIAYRAEDILHAAKYRAVDLLGGLAHGERPDGQGHHRGRHEGTTDEAQHGRHDLLVCQQGCGHDACQTHGQGQDVDQHQNLAQLSFP
ncbi:hypothetical protein ACWDRR_23880 [Kitasatospora sp. NPDC003701]